MKIHSLFDLSNDAVRLLLTTEFSKITDSDIVKNYHPDHRDFSGNIFSILDDPHGRYHRGCYYVVEDGGEFVCSAGWNEYELDSTIALALTRAYVAPKYRGQFPMAKYILPKIIDATAKYKEVLITSNDYNSAIYQAFVRAEQGKYNTWPDIYKKFKPQGTRSIYYTQQQVARLER
jgi:hypothetical protein